MLTILLATALLASPTPLDQVPSGSPLPDQHVTSSYGWRRMDHRFHPGVDLRGSTGTPVRAPAAGKVRFVGQAGEYGLLVILDHGGGVQTWYAHLSRATYVEGTAVAVGQVFARVGSSGHATGPHLHYEVRVGGVPRNPLPFMRGDTE